MSSSALTRPTLVLNKSWQPVRVATAARCLIMLWNGTVKAVDLNDYQTYSWEDWSRITPGDEHVVFALSSRTFWFLMWSCCRTMPSSRSEPSRSVGETCSVEMPISVSTAVANRPALS